MDPDLTRPLSEVPRSPVSPVVGAPSRSTRVLVRSSVPPPAPWPPVRRSRPGDVAATIVLLVVLGFLAALASLAGGLVSVAVTSCSFDSSSCLDWVIAGTAVAVLAPPVCWVAALVASIVAMVRRRRAVWIPLAGVMAWVGLVAIALLIAGLGAGG